MATTDSSFTLADGVRLHVRTVSAPAGDAPTLLVPNGVVYLDDLAPLARTHRLVAYDLRNRGASDADPNARGVPGDVDDLAAVRAALGGPRCATLGHSYVGTVVALHAMRYPGSVERVVMIGAPPPEAAATYPPELAYADDVLPAALAELQRLHAARDPRDPVAFARAAMDVLRPIYVADPAFAPRIRWDRMELANERDFLAYWTRVVQPSLASLAPADFAGVTAPILVVHGARDRNAPLGGAHDWAARLPGARLVVAPRAGHAPWIEDPEILPAIAAFLAEPTVTPR